MQVKDISESDAEQIGLRSDVAVMSWHDTINYERESDYYSISMSVSARIKQYGVMRAVGMDEHQVRKMIVAEASTYAFSGCLIGCSVGLPLSKLMYGKLITAHRKSSSSYIQKDKSYKSISERSRY